MAARSGNKVGSIYDDLKKKIISGELPIGHQLPPEKVLAAQYGVAGLTLRKSLKKLKLEGWIISQRYHGTRVSHPDHPRLANKLIGLVLPKTLQALSHPVFTRFANGVEGVLSETGYGLELAVSNAGNKVQEKALLSKLSDPAIDGWLVPASLSLAAQEALAALKKPKVQLHFCHKKISPHCLEVDHMALAMEILKHLVRHKYRRIWVIGPPGQPGFLESMNILAGSSLGSKGLTIRAKETKDFQMASARTACREVLQKYSVDAFVCADDELAFGAMEALTEFGLSAPEVGVVGGGDFPFGLLTQPPLTTVHYPYYQVGREAARILLDLIENKPVEEASRRFLPRLVERQSTMRQVAGKAGRRPAAHS